MTKNIECGYRSESAVTGPSGTRHIQRSFNDYGWRLHVWSRDDHQVDNGHHWSESVGTWPNPGIRARDDWSSLNKYEMLNFSKWIPSFDQHLWIFSLRSFRIWFAVQPNSHSTVIRETRNAFYEKKYSITMMNSCSFRCVMDLSGCMGEALNVIKNSVAVYPCEQIQRQHDFYNSK